MKKSPTGFDKTSSRFFQIFVAFSEKMDFKRRDLIDQNRYEWVSGSHISHLNMVCYCLTRVTSLEQLSVAEFSGE